jgi:outer membrane biogenesis lipoprotein LolB
VAPMQVCYSQKFRLSFFLLLVFLLTSCSYFEEKETRLDAFSKKFTKVPKNWSLKARGSVQSNSELVTFSIAWSQNDDNFKVVLSGGFLSLVSMVFEKKNKQLKIDNKPIKSTIKDWMLDKYGWFFPVYEIPKWIFTHQKENDDWSIKISSFKDFNYQGNLFKQAPKKLKLIHKQNNIKIKLIIKEIKTP